MARRYDSHTTTFSPEGRLYQVEYAIEAISHAGAAVGIRTTKGVILAAEKKILSKLLETGTASEKMCKLDDHVAVAVAGINSDANLLINAARLFAQRYAASYSEPVPVEQLVHHLCDQKQGYTQFGGLRPFGVSFLYAGWFVFYILFPLNFPKSRILGIKALAFNFIKAIPPATMPAGRLQR